MTLTDKGWETFYKWQGIYYNELYNLKEEFNDPEYEEGWCIIDNEHYVKDIDDEIGLLIFGYDDGVMDHLCWYRDKYKDDEYAFGYTAQDIINILISDGYVKGE